MTITSQGTPATLTVSAVPTGGITPLPVTFSYQFSGSAQSLSIDFDGDGIDDLITADPAAPLQYTYSTPGIYLARLRVTDAQSAVSEAVVGIQALTLASMDAFFQVQWNG
ncbi:MAG TPA: PKD domain-containing protein, partial [Candidatus Kryptonia bacterium]|nr:PKD domain-containing protein [Candidatus Kryptonia bacterium]